MSDAPESLTESEFDTLIALAKRVRWTKDRALKRRIQSEGLHILPASFYSQVPSVDEIEGSFEYRDARRGPFHSEAIFRPEGLQAFLAEVAPYAEEFDPPLEGDRDRPAGFFWKNPAFSYSDAMMYYCVVRHFKPQRILEIGSGFSTLVAEQALRRNGTGALTLIEPYPKAFLRELEHVDRLIERPVQEIPLSELIAEIEGADLWFIDSTHTVKAGSDCLYIYLEAMPAVSRELVVHSHDIHLPFPFSHEQLIDLNIHWTEQYLLYAYLLHNPRVEVLFGSTWAAHFMADELARFMGGKYPPGGGSFWYRLNGGTSAP